MKHKWFGVLSVLFITLTLSFGAYSDAFATNISNFSVNIATGGNYNWISGKSWGQSFTANYIRRIEPHFTFSGTPSGNFGALNSTFNLVNKYCSYSGTHTQASLINGHTIAVEQVVVNNGQANIEERAVSYAVTDWTSTDGNYPGATCYNKTFTFYVSASFSNFSAGSNPEIYFTIGSDTAFLYDPGWTSSNQYQSYDWWYFEDASANVTTVAFDNSISNAILQTQVNQNAQIINLLGQSMSQEQQRYDQEKAEESEREEQGQDDAEDMAGVFNFSIPFILTPLFAGFTSGNSCVNIPVLASLINSNETRFCPFFPARVRTIMTPIFSIAGSLLLFGFIMRWLGGGSGEVIGAGTIEDRKAKTSTSYWRIGGELH